MREGPPLGDPSALVMLITLVVVLGGLSKGLGGEAPLEEWGISTEGGGLLIVVVVVV